LDQPVGRITQLRLYPIRPLWSVGPGWAAVSGGLAAGGFSLSPETLLSFLLVWLLADPVLGVMWSLSTGGSPSEGASGIWRRLLAPQLPDVAPPLRLLPYTQPGSPGRRLADRLGRLRLWWQDTFWPEAGQEFATVIAALGLALLLGAILGRDVLALVLITFSLSWLAALTQGERTPETPARGDVVNLWRALAEFGIPWLIGAVVLGRPSWVVITLGACYTITYFGLMRQATRSSHDFRLTGVSQATAALLLAGLRHPLAAGATAILLLPQWGLRTWTTGESRDHSGASGPYLRGVQLFVILGMLVAALAVAL
jgi:hypothetical protein